MVVVLVALVVAFSVIVPVVALPLLLLLLRKPPPGPPKSSPGPQNGKQNEVQCLATSLTPTAVFLLALPYSTNSRFSELFREFSGVILGGVRHYLETIWGSFWTCLVRISRGRLFNE